MKGSTFQSVSSWTSTVKDSIICLYLKFKKMDKNSSSFLNESLPVTVNYPREASYFAAACAILFIIVGIGGWTIWFLKFK